MEFDPIPRDDLQREDNLKRDPLPKTSNECPHCKNTGIVKEEDGGVHTCWKCLEEGRLDAHSKSLPDNEDIKL